MVEISSLETASPSSQARRRGALDGRSHAGLRAKIEPCKPAKRMNLRVRPDGIARISAALGLELPQKPKHSVSVGTRSALWLGPDEWLVIDEGEKDPMADLAGQTVFHSAVDVSQRNIGIQVSGVEAADVLNAGCPQDLSLGVFPVGACSRTVLGKIEVVIWRRAETEFRVECWRSFADYAFSYLEDAA